MSAVIANHSPVQRAAAAAGIVRRAARRWGVRPELVRYVAGHAAAGVLLHGQSVAGAVAAARLDARAQGGAA